MKLHIVSDGTPHGTRVTNEKGEAIEGIQGITWTIGLNNRAQVLLDIRGVTVDVEGEKP